MLYNFVADSIQTKKRCSRLSSSKVKFCTENDRFAFLNPLWGPRGNVRVTMVILGSLESAWTFYYN